MPRARCPSWQSPPERVDLTAAIASSHLTIWVGPRRALQFADDQALLVRHMRTIRLGRRLWPVVFAVVLATSVEAKQTPTFKSTVNIVSVDVVALDKDGRPARGLVPENFTVTLDGHPAPVKVLSFVESQSTDTSPKAGDEIGRAHV